MIEVKNLSFQYKKKDVLKDIDVRFDAGEFVLLAGNNGAGKSTFLRCLMGALSPVSGEINYRENLSKKQIGFISDRLSLFEHYSLNNMIDFHTRVFETDGYDDTLIRTLELDRNARVKSLSVGQRTLFLFSLVMAQKPLVLLLDEVIHAVDAYLRELFLEQMLDLIANHNTTVIAVNHTFTEIEKIPDRVLVMEDGRFILDEKTDALRAKVKKLEPRPGIELPGQLPVLFQKETPYIKECYVFPFEEKMRDMTDQPFRDVNLPEILKSFIGGYYVKKRI